MSGRYTLYYALIYNWDPQSQKQDVRCYIGKLSLLTALAYLLP